MQRTFLAAMLLLGAVANADARPLDRYYDTIRQNGHPRADAVFQSALNACYAQTGASRNRADTPAFKRCMRGRGYRWLSASIVRTPRSAPGSVDPFSYTYPDTPLPPAPVPPPIQPPPDATTGMPIPGYSY